MTKGGCPPSSALHSLSSQAQRRYARHIVLTEIGEAGQQKLLGSSVFVVGAGGLGSHALMALAAAGIGRLGIAEPDRLELSNLQRQTLYETADIGRPKAKAAADRLSEINPDVTIDVHALRLDADNASALIAPYDIIIDGTDNFETRFILNDACKQAKKPWVYAAMVGFSGQLSVFTPYLGKAHPCYRCLVPEIPERLRNCAQEGIIGPLAGIMGNMQALEAIKVLLGMGESLSGWLVTLDALTFQVKKIRLLKDSGCCE